MLSNISANSTMQQNNTTFGCKRKVLSELMIDPVQRAFIENNMKNEKISDLQKQKFLEIQALRTSSNLIDLLGNIVANLKLKIFKTL